MTTITKNKNQITVEGHAENTPLCNSISSSINMLYCFDLAKVNTNDDKEKPKYTLMFKDNESCAKYMHYMTHLKTLYPKNLNIIR